MKASNIMVVFAVVGLLQLAWASEAPDVVNAVADQGAGHVDAAAAAATLQADVAASAGPLAAASLSGQELKSRKVAAGAPAIDIAAWMNAATGGEGAVTAASTAPFCATARPGTSCVNSAASAAVHAMCKFGICAAVNFGVLPQATRSADVLISGTTGSDYTGQISIALSREGQLCTFNPRTSTPPFCVGNKGPLDNLYVLGVTSLGSLTVGNVNNPAAPVWVSPRPQVTFRAGAAFWAFAAPDGGMYVVYGTAWNAADSRIVLACNSASPAGTCSVIPPTMPAATYDALHTQVFRNVKTTGTAF